LLPDEEVRQIWLLRKHLSDRNPVQAMAFLISRLKRTASNAECLKCLIP
jgi:transcription termination factor Rho